MKLIEVKIILEDIENNCNVNLITINGVKAWPLLRSIIWSEFTKSQVNEKSIFRREYSLAQKMIYLLDKFGLNSLLATINPKKLDNSTEVLFIGRAQHRVKIQDTQKCFDRILDPLVHVIDPKTFAKSFTLGIPRLRNTYYPNERLRARRSVPERHIVGLEESGLFAYLSQLNVSTESLWSAVRLGVKAFSKSYVMGCDLLSKIPNTRLIFLSVWYSLDALGIIAAAHQRDIQVIDIQHGGEMHGMYAGWSRIPENGYELLPDIFWCWGEESSDRIQRGMRTSSKHRTIVGGNPWQEFRKARMSEGIDNDKSMTHMAPSTKRILFSLQPLSFDDQKRIPDFVLNFLKLDHSEFYFKFRRHPNDPNDKNELRQLRKMKFKTQFEIEDSSADLISSISGANFHISAYSSVAFECLSLGVPSLLFGEQSKVLYDREIQEKVFSWTSGEINDLFKFLDGEIEPKDAHEKYVSTSLELARSTMLEIILDSN